MRRIRQIALLIGKVLAYVDMVRPKAATDRHPYDNVGYSAPGTGLIAVLVIVFVYIPAALAWRQLKEVYGQVASYL